MLSCSPSSLPFVQMALQTEKTYLRINYAFHSRYRYRRKLFWNLFFVADTDTVVLCSLEGPRIGDRNYFGIIFYFVADTDAEILFSNNFRYQFGRGKFSSPGMWHVMHTTRVWKWKKRVFRNTHFPNTALHLLLFSIRQHVGLRAKNACAETPLVNNGIQQMRKPLAFWDACSKRRVVIMRFGLSKASTFPYLENPNNLLK